MRGTRSVDPIDSAHAPRNSPLHATRSITAPPTNGGIAGLGLRDPPNTAEHEARVASKTERIGVVHGSWTKRGEYAAASRTESIDFGVGCGRVAGDRIARGWPQLVR